MENNYKDSNFIYSFELYDKYLLSFNCDQMPINFDKWIQLDIEKIKLSNTNLIKILNDNIYLCLNKYLYVVIESNENDFTIEFARVHCKVQKGKKYIPIFPIYHDFYIEKIKKGFDTNNNISKEINLIDKYVQYNFIKFYSRN
jgi:hypothetical protein